MAIERMTLDQFLRDMGDRLDAFRRNVAEAQAEQMDGFVGEQFERRSFEDWMAEFEAHEATPEIGRSVLRFDNRKRLTAVR